MARRSLLMAIAVALLGATVLTAHAAVLMTQQGRLTDALGAPLPDGPYVVTFCITTGGGTVPVWQETQTVPLKDGLFSVILGTFTPLDESKLHDGGGGVYLAEIERYITVKVTGYPDLPPVRLTGVPYAAVATRMTGDFESEPGEITVINVSDPGYGQLNGAGMVLFGGLSPTVPAAALEVDPVTGPEFFLDQSLVGGGHAFLATPEGLGEDFDEDGNWNYVFDEFGVYCDLGDDQSPEIDFYTFAPDVAHAPAFLTTGPNVTNDFLGPTRCGNRFQVDLCPAQPGFEIDCVNGTPPCNGARMDIKVPVNITGNVAVTGDQTVTGTKSFVQDHPTLPDKQIVYVSLEGNEAGTYTRGSGRLALGSAEVTLPEDFGFVTGAVGLTAQITPRGPVQAMLYVESVLPGRLVVRASSGADGDVPFDFLVQGVRLGFENHQVIRDKPLSPAPDPEYIKQTPTSPRRSGTFGTPGR